MRKQTEIIENFKRAITSTVKSIIGDDQVQVIFGNEVSKKDKKTITLPNLININNLLYWYLSLFFLKTNSIHYVITTRAFIRFLASLLVLSGQKVIIRR